MDELENFENIVQMTWKEYATKLLMENTEKQTHEDIVTNIINTYEDFEMQYPYSVLHQW